MLAELLPETVDLTVTSPPYDALRKYHSYDYDFPFQAILIELFRVTKPGGVVVWVVADETWDFGRSGTSMRQAIHFMDIGFKLFDHMVYEKSGTSFPSRRRYTNIYEHMFVFSKGKPKTVNLIKDVPKLWQGSWGQTTQRQKDGSLKKSTAKSCGKATKRATGAEYGYKARTNIWRIVNGKKFAHSDDLAYDHPATFPESLAHDHILSWSNKGDLVLDPLCGSGTTCKMAKKLGRQYIGIDVSKEYVKLAKQRVKLV
ncbi:MAG: site-specific DNA-methyltransferase [Chloroflexi bacterium]|nr:MAG: site-specific DNA-methyltransferase [Chloroflexota bacterium]